MTGLPVAVVGFGHIGRFHAKVYQSTPGVRLAAVCESAPAARAEAEALGLPVVGRVEDLPRDIRAASVCVQTAAHAGVTRQLLSRRISCLVEKPATGSSEGARTLGEEARRQGAVLMPGHVERFNPAVRAASEAVDRAGYIESLRISPFRFRSGDVDVVMDLMIHDIDVVLHLAGARVSAVRAVGVPVITAHADVSAAWVEFEGGCVASLRASRVSLKQARELRIFAQDAYVSIDYAARSGRIVRHRRGGPPPSTEADLLKRVDERRLQTPEEEPLAAELAAFRDAVGGGVPAIRWEEAVEALSLAERIQGCFLR